MLQIIPVFEDYDYEEFDELGIDGSMAMNEAEKLFSQQGISISRIEELAFIAICGNEIVGASTLGSYPDSSIEQATYTFSVAVVPEWRRRGLARKLVQESISRAMEDERGTNFRVWVVNPHMIPLLESLGFSTEGEWSQDNPFMELIWLLIGSF